MRGLVKQTVQQSVLQKIPHTYQRNGMYYFCYRVPKVIRIFYSFPSMIRQSLHTRSAIIASSMVNSFVSAFNEIKVHCVTKKIKKNIKQEFISIPTFLGDLIIDQGNGDIEAEKIVAKEILKDNPHLTDPDSARELTEIKAKLVTNENDASLNQKIKPTIKDMYQKWEASWDEQGLIAKEQENHRRNMAILLYLHGDKQPDSITPKQADEVLSIAKRMPRSNMKPYSSMVKPSFSRELREEGYIQRIKMVLNNEVPETDRVANFSPVLKSCQGFYSWMASKYIVNDKPFNDRRIKSPKKNKRGAFTVSELQRIVDFSSQQTDANKKWIPLIMAYTGMRNSEIQELERSQFKVCEDSGLFLIQVGITTSEVGKAKTEAGIRRVPLAQPLIDLGLMEYINSFSQPNERVFSVPNKWLTRYYGNTLQKACQLPEVDSSGHMLSMYSTRHSVVSFVRSQGANEAISTAIVGHENGSSVHDNYTTPSLFPLNALKLYVDGLPWKIRADYTVTI